MLGYLYSHGHLTRAVCCRLARDGDKFRNSLPPNFALNHPEVPSECCQAIKDVWLVSSLCNAFLFLYGPLQVGRVSVYDSTRHTGKTKESSVNWSQPDQLTVEVLDGTKGKFDRCDSLNNLPIAWHKSHLHLLASVFPQHLNPSHWLSSMSPAVSFHASPKMEVSRVSKSNLFRLFHRLCQSAGRIDLLALPSYAHAKMAATSFQDAKRLFFLTLTQHGYGNWIGKPLEEKSFEGDSTSMDSECAGASQGCAVGPNRCSSTNNSLHSTSQGFQG